jgi:hypothetical protein
MSASETLVLGSGMKGMWDFIKFTERFTNPNAHVL